MELTDMARWPGTPEARRLVRAKDILEGRGQAWAGSGDEAREAQHDARMLQATIETLEFTERETAELLRKNRAEQVNTSRDLVRAGMMGTSAGSIGMVIHPEDEGLPFIVTRLHSDPGWVGLNPSLEFCRGLEVHLFGMPDAPTSIGLVIAAAHWDAAHSGEQSEPEGEMEEAISEAVLWHGATRCLRVGTR